NSEISRIQYGRSNKIAVFFLYTRIWKMGKVSVLASFGKKTIDSGSGISLSISKRAERYCSVCLSSHFERNSFVYSSSDWNRKNDFGYFSCGQSYWGRIWR